MQEMSLLHAEDIASASRRKAATLSSLAHQVELDREEWGRTAKDEASKGGTEVHPRVPVEVLALRPGNGSGVVKMRADKRVVARRWNTS